MNREPQYAHFTVAGAVVVPDNIDLEEVELVEAHMKYLRLYAKKNAGVKK